MRSVVLVTGGSGFIGSHVVDRLLAAGMSPRIFDRRPSPWHDPAKVPTVVGDVMRVEDLTRAMRGCDTVCHLAAAADVGEVKAHPHWATELNAGGTLNVLEAARELEVRRVVYASTVWVYSDVDADLVDEDTPLVAPAHLYTAGKLSGELYCRSFRELYGLETTILRFGIPYGPRARPAAVIPSFVDHALHGEPLTIAGTGEQERSFLFVEDLAEGVVRALAPVAAGRTYNLAGSETVTIRRLAEIVNDVVGGVRIEPAPGRAADLSGATVDSRRAERELGWRAETTLQDGILRYVEWLREQPNGDVSTAQPTRRRVVDHHRLTAVVAAGIGNPVVVGLVALIAVASAAISVVLGAREEAQTADITALGSAILLPLWALTVVPWPHEYRRRQAALTALLGLLGIVLLGVLSAAPGGGSFHPLRIAFVVAVSACLTSALRVVPRRFAELRSHV